MSKPRRDSISKSGPNLKRSAIPTPIKTKEVTKIDDLKWAIKTVKKQEFITFIKTNEKPQTIGHTPGQLMAEMDHATRSSSLKRRLNQLKIFAIKYNTCWPIKNFRKQT